MGHIEPVVTVDDVRQVALALPGSYEVLVPAEMFLFT
jgi:hypothetical protein